ncbi:YfhO family protein [Patescibacteria group bacterium]|nr:YfhO family protein [Patescibacteria group bacterium]MBU1970510.1 YfhO family protein [Patescibacteria group bacterium]
MHNFLHQIHQTAVKKCYRHLFIGILLFLVILWMYRFLLEPGIFFKGGDVGSLHLPAVFYLQEKILHGRFPLWSERLYLGFPVYANGEFAFFSPIRLFLVLFFTPLTVLKVEFLFFCFLGAFSLFVLQLKKGISPFFALTSTLVYFFSFPLLSRLMHLNIVYCLFLVPTNIIIYEFQKTSRKPGLFICLRLLTFFLLLVYGNYHGLLISLIPEIFYVLFDDSFPLRKRLWYFSASAFLGLILALPFILPSYKLYEHSARRIEPLDYSEGSYSFMTLANGLYPYFLGTPENYIGETANSRLFIQETLFYFGFCALTTAFVYFLSKDNLYTKSFLASFYLFLVLSTLKTGGLSAWFNFPPINLFRYWGRVAMILPLPLALSVSAFLNDFKDVKSRRQLKLKKLLFFVPPVLYLAYLYFFQTDNSTDTVLLSGIKSGLLVIDPYIGFWKRLVLVFLVTFLLYIFLHKKAISLLLALLVCVDVTYFAATLLNTQKTDYANFFNPSLHYKLTDLANERVVYFSDEIVGNKPLLYPAWSPFGYISSYESLSYKQLFSSHDLSVRRLGSVDNYYSNEEFFKALGVKAYIDQVDAKLIDTSGIFSTLSPVEILVKEEGHIKARISGNQESYLQTRIKNYPGWFIKLNGHLVKPLPSELFLKIPLSQGENVLEMHYYPLDLYVGLFLSLTFLMILYLLLKYIGLIKVR